MPARSLQGFLNPLAIRKKHPWILLPLAGSIVFIALYLVAASLYPGGSQADTHSKGFSWMHNYWCNLLNEKGINGEVNGGRAVALLAMAVLGLTLVSFWIITASLAAFSKPVKLLVIVSGIIAVALLPALPSAYHDVVINVSGFFGLIAMAAVYVAVYRNGWMNLFAFGIFNLLLVGLNNYLYHSGGSLYYLPLVQKISFASFLLWICLVDVRLYQRSLPDK